MQSQMLTSYINSKKPLEKLEVNSTHNSKAVVGQLDKDVFESSKSKDKQNKNKTQLERALSLGVIAGVVTTLLFLIRKNNYSEVKKLAKNIQFNPSATVEEAINFGQKTLKIPEYSGFSDNDLDVINWLNEGMVNVANKMKGELRMPKKVCYADLTDIEPDMIAGVITTKKSEFNGYFCLNKAVFENIDNEIKESISALLEKDYITEGATGYQVSPKWFSCKEIDELLNKYKQGKLPYNQKVQLFISLRSLADVSNKISNSPFDYIEQLAKKLLSKNDKIKNHTLEEIKGFSGQVQTEYLAELFKLAKKNKLEVRFEVLPRSPFSDIYHEFGHLQDKIPRCPSIHKFDSPSKYPAELKSWVQNQEYIDIANRVSKYAASGPGEFIAEVYAKMLDGLPLSQDVADLYNKLKGPKIP